MYPTISITSAESTWNNALDAWQDWSDTTFDQQYREAILTLVAGLATLAGYLIGYACCWLLLQLVKTVRYWLTDAVQAVPVLNGWWKAPFVEISATQYPEFCWQAIAPTTLNAILDYELSWAVEAAAIPIDIS
ncbi:hypothetical protein BH23CYA1_BH23CYA1_16720 [soil metagenome]